MRDVAAFFNKQTDAAVKSKCADDFVAIWKNLADLYAKKHWHQMTEVLHQLVRRPEMNSEEKLMELYEEAIADFEVKLKPVSLVEIVSPIFKSMKDSEKAYAFIEKIGQKLKKDQEAVALTKIVRIRRVLEGEYDSNKLKTQLEEIEGLLDELEGVGKVHRDFYRLSSDFFCKEGNHSEYYRAALHFLGCTDLETISSEENQALAVKLSLSALLGKDVFNFGELIAHPVLGYLKGNENEWLSKLLEAFNKGDVDSFRKLKKFWSKQPDLAANEEVLYEKICLLALMNMTFERPTTERQLSFADIAGRTGLSEDKIELLAMKAQSSGLIKGQIDEVLKIINVSWVQPRVLDREQLKTLLTKVEDWSRAITLMEDLIQSNASDILTA